MAGGAVRQPDMRASAIDLQQMLRPVASMRTGVFQLPPDIDDFTGREDDLRAVQSGLEPATDHVDVIVSAIAGRAGVGKTALATKLAHQLQPRFPDGQLYVNLRGSEVERLAPADVLGEFLLELGVARAAIPERIEQRASRYRAQLAKQRVLVVLDNAADEAQVRPLLPRSPNSAALITSRARLAKLRGARSITLDVLDPDQAVELLARVVGERRVAAQPEAARRIVELCGYLPLAIRIAGARLAARGQWPLTKLANRLADEHDLLAEFRLRDVEVRASFTLTYQALAEDERRAFRYLSLLKAPEFTAWVAAALLDTELDQARELVQRLVRSEVVEVARQGSTSETRYRFHDVLRAFARERLWNEDGATAQEAALERTLDAYLDLTRYVATLLEPGDRRPSFVGWPQRVFSMDAGRIADDPSAWFADERLNLISAVEQAYENGLLKVTWELAGTLTYFFKLRSHWTHWQRTQELALRAARRVANDQAMASALRSLGDVYSQRGRFDKAIREFTQCLVLFRSLGDRRGEAWTLVGLANAHREQGALGEAMTEFEQGLRLFRSLGDPQGEAWTLEGLGVLHRNRGEFSKATECFAQGLDLARAAGDRREQAYCLVNLAIVHRERGQFDPALTWYDQARPIFRQLGDNHGEAFVLLNIAHIQREQRRFEESRASLRRA
jgi:tetratricopeptide (TPR) repeat protein